MDYNHAKADEIVLALLNLNSMNERSGTATYVRAWKGFPWEIMDRLHEQGLISDPRSKSKSVVLSEEGARRSERLFLKHFGIPSSSKPA